jgi:hypothetical protein
MDKTMNRSLIYYAILVAAFVDSQPYAEAESLHKVWELRLDPLIKESSSSSAKSPHTVSKIQFSPDEHQLAIVVGMHSVAKSFTSHLLVLKTDTPATVIRESELEQGILPGEEDYPVLLWSPDGDAVSVSGMIILLRDGGACSFATWDVWLGGYLDNHTQIGRLTGAPVDREHPKSRFLLFGNHCDRGDVWTVEDAWRIDDVSPHSGLALVRQSYLGHVGLFDPPRGATLLVDFLRRQVLRRWQADELLPHQVRFAEGGKTVCAAGGGVKQYAVPIRCLNVDTGKVIAEAPSVKDALGIVTAADSSRVVISQYRPDSDDRPTTPVLERRIVWDFRTGQQIAAWRPEFQKWRYPIGTIGHWRGNPFVFAISPTGRYIAEGGNGVLRLYEVEP